jgi:myo-inositol 2-dehydrogenase/D-chiro-inositol 1-dehydrogenase
MSGDISRRRSLQIGAATVAAGLRAQVRAEEAAKEEEGPKVRVGFIGIGGRGRGLLSATLNNKKATVVGICDIRPDNFKKAMEMVEKAQGKAPEGYDKGPEDYKRMLERKDMDAIVTATPCNLHAQISVDTIAAGKHIYGEKPMGICVKELDDVCKAAEGSPKLVVQVGYQWMCNPRFIEAIKRVHDGEIGDIVEGRFARHNSANPLRGWFSHRKESGDWMLEQACHEFNVMNWLMQDHPLRVFALGRRDIWTEGEPDRDVTDFYSAVIEYPRNIIVNYSHDWHSPQGLTGMDIKAVGMKGSTDIFGGQFAYRDAKKKPEPIKAPGVDDTQEAINTFVKCVLKGEKPLPGPHYGRLASHIGLMIRKSVDTKAVVDYDDMLKTC